MGARLDPCSPARFRQTRFVLEGICASKSLASNASEAASAWLLSLAVIGGEIGIISLQDLLKFIFGRVAMKCPKRPGIILAKVLLVLTLVLINGFFVPQNSRW